MRKYLVLLLAFTSFYLASAARQHGQYAFIENKGQITDQQRKPNPQVKYLLNTPGLNVQLRNNGFSYDAYTIETQKPAVLTRIASTVAGAKQTEANLYRYNRIDVAFPGANPNPEIIAGNKARSYLNYYNEIGHFTNISQYENITYKNLYPGIDLQFITTADKAIEYNFIVHPGADASLIQMQYQGALSTQLKNGKIDNQTALGLLQEHIPASFIHETKEPVAVSYKQTGIATFGYAISNYDKTQTLVIDPTPDLAWGTYYGGGGDDHGHDIEIQGSDVYITGSTQSATAIATTGAHQTNLSGTADAFITKIDRIGVRQWSTYFGGSGTDIALGASAISGSICIVGQTNSSSGIATTTAHQTIFGGSYDGFLAKFSTTGALQFATYIGGSDIEYASSVAISPGAVSTICVAGTSASVSGIPVTNAHQSAMAGVADAFLVQYSFTGFPVWGTYAGSGNIDEGYSVAADANGNVFLAGLTYQPTNNNLITAGAHQTVYGGDTTDYFVQKYNANGQRLWGTYYGGAKGEERVDGEKLATDASGNLYFAGSSWSANDIATGGSHQSVLGGGLGDEDGFITKFNGNGVRQWSTYYGGTGGDLVSAIATDNSGNIYATGYTFSATGIATNASYQTAPNGTDLEVFLAKFNGSGTRLWGSYYGGSNVDVSEAISIDAQNNAFLTGFTYSTGDIPTNNAHQLSIGGGRDAFIARFRACTIFTFSGSASIFDVSCFGKGDGMIVATATGGQQPYTFRFGPLSPFTTADTLKSLVPGIYNVTAMDDNGCTATLNPAISEPVQITTPAIAGAATVTQKNTETYTTPLQLPGTIYQWTATGGTIASGQGTEQVQVTWTSAGPVEVKVKVSGSATSACPDSAIFSVFADFPVSVASVQATTALRIYPNPAQHNVVVEAIDAPVGATLKLFDKQGKLVLTQPLHGQQSLDISGLPAGIYSITAGSSSARFSKL